MKEEVYISTDNETIVASYGAEGAMLPPELWRSPTFARFLYMFIFIHRNNGSNKTMPKHIAVSCCVQCAMCICELHATHTQENT